MKKKVLIRGKGKLDKEKSFLNKISLKILNAVKKDKVFTIVSLSIALVTIFLRFYNYGNRWIIAADQASFAILARYAIETRQLPPLGPFSSAGPFQTGGEWYWWIILSTIPFFNSHLTPWIVLTLSYAVFAILLIKLGVELVDKKFGLIIGALAAVSTAQLTLSVNLTNQAPISIFSLIAIWSSIRYLKTKKIKFLFLLSLTIGIASSIHLQGLALFPLILFTLIFAKVIDIKAYLILILGLLTPWLPVFLTDYSRDFFNTRNMIYYYLVDQNKIPYEVLGRRWLTFVGVFIPNAIANINGGFPILGYISFFSFTLIVIVKSLKRSLSKELLVLFLSFISMIAVLRYTRTPIFDSYVNFLSPFVIIFTGLFIHYVFEKNKVVGFILISIFLFGSLQKDYFDELSKKDNYNIRMAGIMEKRLIEKFPSDKFALYDHKRDSIGKTLPLVLLLQAKNKIDDNGRKIGLGITSEEERKGYNLIYKDEQNQILDIGSIKPKPDEWEFINPSRIYNVTENWYKN